MVEWNGSADKVHTGRQGAFLVCHRGVRSGSVVPDRLTMHVVRYKPRQVQRKAGPVGPEALMTQKCSQLMTSCSQVFSQLAWVPEGGGRRLGSLL